MKFLKLLFAVAGLAVAGVASAAPTADELKQLGTTLTPWGAEKAGNKEGTIPEYTGGVKNPPKMDLNVGIPPDPFADDKILFWIDAKNMDKYANKLSPGIQAMLKKYASTFRIAVYPTHRSVSYPQQLIDNTLKNARENRCSTAAEGNTLDTSKGCRGGFPFPIPKDGYEVMWNRNASFNGGQALRLVSNHFVKPSGERVMTAKLLIYDANGIYDPDKKIVDNHTEWRNEYWAPSRLAGQTVVLWDKLTNERFSHSYQPSTRRTRLSPDLAGDTPIAVFGGAMVYDEGTMFSGSMDRFDFKLVGKQEMYIPYNNYRTGTKECMADGGKIIQPLHWNPECMRWELHRVWRVHATIKPGKRHIYKERDFYFDEDAWYGGIVDEYDFNNQIYRIIPVALRPDYANNAPTAYPDVMPIDLISGTWGWTDAPAHWVLAKRIPDTINPESAPTHMLKIPKY